MYSRGTSVRSRGRLLSWHPLSKLPHQTNGRTFDPPRMIQRATGPMHDESSVESCIEPSVSEAETLPLGHGGLNYMSIEYLQ
ncbi:hypothetical protein AVEN_251854-1 [Araneus ventricosus]|uniref:Uncharacterized protein n=1 Tax=Araneus ventricosus TaxID=182803 RepID=A0A4Y2FUF0_ARAVE|nr:hypothetical protein AVEN_251854-1 [Araneus ventricosus]